NHQQRPPGSPNPQIQKNWHNRYGQADKTDGLTADSNERSSMRLVTEALRLLMTGLLLAWPLTAGNPAHAQAPAQLTAPELQELLERLEAQEAELARLRAELLGRTAVQPAGHSTGDLHQAHTGDGSTPWVDNGGSEFDEQHIPASFISPSAKVPSVLACTAAYDKGFLIRPHPPHQDVFSMKVNGWIQFRYHGFDRDVDS